MERYLIDTNIISDYFTDSTPSNANAILDKIFDDIPNISIITQIELLSWKTESTLKKIINQFISDCKIFEINQEVVLKCAQLRQKRKIHTPDAIIAATAIVYGYTLITNNEKDFLNIKHLKVLNPYKI
jgi:predicted nucleic acid-binding protein